MTDEETYLKEAEATRLLQAKAQTLSPIHWCLAAQVLALWIDQLRIGGRIFFTEMSRASDAAAAQAALERFDEHLSQAATERGLDLLTAIGDYVPARDDHDRQKIFLAVTTSTSKQ